MNMMIVCIFYGEKCDDYVPSDVNISLSWKKHVNLPCSLWGWFIFFHTVESNPFSTLHRFEQFSGTSVLFFSFRFELYCFYVTSNLSLNTILFIFKLNKKLFTNILKS